MDTVGTSTPNAEPVLRGVIDSLEEEWAVVVLDDGQRLDWPRERLPEGARSGAAVVLKLETGELSAADVQGVWPGVAEANVRPDALDIHLDDQTLRWPAAPFRTLGSDEAVAVRMTVDDQDTAQRRRQVQSLIDDLFG